MKKSTLFIGFTISFLGLWALVSINPIDIGASTNLTCKPGSVSGAYHSWNWGIPIVQNKLKNVEVEYYLNSVYGKQVEFEKLQAANSLEDFIVDYPSNWIKEYTSVDLSVDESSDVVSGSNSKFTPDQKKLIQSVEVGDRILLEVNYKVSNSATGVTEDRKMVSQFIVVPDKQAHYPGDMEALLNYLRENSYDQIEDKERLVALSPATTVSFTINEEGKASDVEMAVSSENKILDKLLMKIISEMPTWIPAENADGKKISQKFQFILGKQGC